MLEAKLTADEIDLLQLYLKGLQAYIPLDAIQAQLQQTPHNIRQEESLSEEDKIKLAAELMKLNLSENEIKSLLRTDVFKDRWELFKNGNE